MQPGRTIRCAIYTRKSSEEGLEQDYNSLHAQRDACASYVMSQAGEGWTLLPEIYDDGGFSGGNIDRPALRRLMVEIEAKRVDVVVVYKVDRLTRSLPDFSRIVDVLDKAGASFVSVTQAFNSTTSMGRLTLNVLLSFAQFEREVTGERIRDKIAASKKKGLWMGGRPVLGYDPDGRTLKINPAEAEVVRWMFTRYLELRSVNQMIRELAAKGVVSKAWINKAGVPQGGLPIERGGAYHMLRNPVYVGDIPHKDEVYPGQHTGLIDRDTYNAVQALLDETLTKRKTPGQPRPLHTGAPLGGLIFDSADHVMSPVSAPRRGGATYRYYVSTALQRGKPDTAGVHGRIPAPAIEDAIQKAIGPLLPVDQSASWTTIRDVIERIDLMRDEAVVRLDLLRCAVQFSSEAARMTLDRLERLGNAPVLRLALTTTRRGALAMAGPDGANAIARRPVDFVLGAALVRAEAWKRKLMSGEAPTLSAIAKDEGVTDGYAARLIRVAFLAPDLKRAILDGDQPAGMTLQSVTTRDVPLAWAEQRRLYSQ